LAEALQAGDKTAVQKAADQLKEVLANAANTARSANE
jgi:N-acetylated-alpha-linked acidic dipeptidase